jgi:hypothetical protein
MQRNRILAIAALKKAETLVLEGKYRYIWYRLERYLLIFYLMLQRRDFRT